MQATNRKCAKRLGPTPKGVSSLRAKPAPLFKKLIPALCLGKNHARGLADEKKLVITLDDFIGDAPSGAVVFLCHRLSNSDVNSSLAAFACQAGDIERFPAAVFPLDAKDADEVNAVQGDAPAEPSLRKEKEIGRAHV